MYLTDLADALRAGGCKVVEVDGWKTRGRGQMKKVSGILWHHTGAGSRDGLLNLIKNGRSDLPGPLSQLFLDDTGTFHVIAAGRCNHAGKGRWQGVTAGNSEFIGIEAMNAGNGVDPWEPAQLAAYVQGAAALGRHYSFDDVMNAGHKEYALPKGRKIDPTLDMFAMRAQVEAAMAGEALQPSFLPITPTNPKRDMLRKGSQNPSVRVLQRLLGVTADGAFGPKTEAAVKAFQQKHGLAVDGLVGPKTWAALEAQKK